MLRNEKLLKNGNKLLKGTHLEAYLSVNAGLTRTYVQYGVSGATADDPLYTLLYDSQGYTFTESISDYSNLQVSYYNTNTSLTKYFLTYGNTDALTSITSTTTGILGGDLKGFINHHTNLNKVNIGNTNMSVNLNNFTWPKGMDYINFSLTPNITGAWDTMSNIDQVTHLSISRGGTLTGAIRDFKNLTYLSYDGWEANDLLVDDASLWTFVPNLSYFYIRYEDNITGNISGWTFSENLENIRFDAMDGVEGDISNWDFSNCGNFGQFIISLNANITGDISGWRFPDDTGDGITVQMRYLGITNIGMDLSNTKFKSFIISSMPSVTSDFSDLIFPDTTTSISISYLNNMGGDIADVYIPDSMLSYAMVSNSLTGDIISLDIPTGITSFYFNNSNVSGNISGLTLWDGLETFSLIDCDNITGTISGVNTTIPTSLDGTFSLSNLNNITLDLTSTFDFKNATTITFTSISGVTGNFSNMIISGCTSLYMNNINNTVPDYGDLSINWDIIEIINI